tara:strand:+ start:471 stop:1028 length:558 start_codon:yes stop_codon:yes gene_type:complete
MTRNTPASLLTALSQPEVLPFYAVEMNFDSAPLRFWTGYGDRTILSNSYTGTGNLLSISGLEEVNDLSAKRITLQLSGVPTELVSLALQEPYQRRSCKIYFGTTDTSTPIEVFSGLMDVMTIEDGGDSSTISLTVESKLVRLEKSSNWRYTEGSHQSRHNGDTFFSYVSDLQDRDIVWGREVKAD